MSGSINKLAANSGQNLTNGANSCPIVSETRDLAQGIASGDFKKASLNAGILSAALVSGAGGAGKMAAASNGAMASQVAAVSTTS